MNAISLARLALVHPELKRRILQLESLLDFDVEVTAGIRTYAEENALYAQGRTMPGPIVTDAQGGYSAHNFGYACFDKRTEVLTKEWGWLPFTMIGRSQVASYDGAALKFEYPKAYIAQAYSGKMTKISTRSCDLLLTNDHKCIASYRKWKTWGDLDTCKAAELCDRHRIPTCARWVGDDEPQSWPFMDDVPSLDWWSFMGWYLSEGWSVGTSDGRRRIGNQRNRVGVSQEKSSSEFASLETLMAKLPFFSRYDGHAFICDSKALWDITFPLGHALTKRIPRYLFNAPVSHLQALWDSLYAGDGSVIDDDIKVYHTSSHGLSSDVSELLTRLGISNSVTSRQRTDPNTAMSYTVIARKRVNQELRNGDGAPRVRHDQGYEGMVYCVSVPSGALFVRRNGKVSISGNCDLVPEDITPGQPDWNLSHPAWQKMLAAGLTCGLAEGARWCTIKDNPHFYLQELPATPTDEMRQDFKDAGIAGVWQMWASILAQ